MRHLHAPPAAVQATELGKEYKLGATVSLGQTVGRLIGRAVRRPTLEAVAELTFEVQRGECFGLVGGNGCGKSTVLQILAGVTAPTSGALTVRGRVLPLLSVGAGFHAELTGRENVTLFAATLGIAARIAVERMDDVAAFAELERHMDTPAKRYSTGMLARLSFAIAMQFPADIYVFDEVLAVVDAAFRERCLDEIGNLHASGKTVLFVSHDADQVRARCDRVLWMESGRMRRLGPTETVLAEYSREAHAAAQA